MLEVVQAVALVDEFLNPVGEDLSSEFGFGGELDVHWMTDSTGRLANRKIAGFSGWV